MPETSILPLPCNTPGLTINPKWEREQNVPQWFGWLVSHILAQIPMRRSTTIGQPVRDISAIAAEITTCIRRESRTGNVFDKVQHELPKWLMGAFLYDPIMYYSPRHPHTDVPSLLLRTINLHDNQSTHQEVPSRKWKELREDITEEMLLLEPERKPNMPDTQATIYRNGMHCLDYALRAAYCIAEEKSHIAISRCARNAVLSYETYTQKLNDTAYLVITEHLIHLLGGQTPVTVPR